jgi:hypothetical protein
MTTNPDVKIIDSNIHVNEAGVVSTSRGLVGDTIFAVIPNVKPIHTFIITIAFQLVSIPWVAEKSDSVLDFIAAVADQALESSHLQVLLDRLNIVWLDVISVWLACA